MKTQTKAKKTQKKADETSEFFRELGLLTYQDRSRFLPASESGQKEKNPIYVPSLSGNSQPFCLDEH